jgi:hypothetical protein
MGASSDPTPTAIKFAILVGHDRRRGFVAMLIARRMDELRNTVVPRHRSQFFAAQNSGQTHAVSEVIQITHGVSSLSDD